MTKPTWKNFASVWVDDKLYPASRLTRLLGTCPRLRLRFWFRRTPKSIRPHDNTLAIDAARRISDVDELVERVLEQNNGHAKTLAARVDMLEQKIIEYSLIRNGQHRKETAAELGISRVTLYNKMKKFGLLD